MAAWHDTRPGVGQNFYLGVAFAAFLVAFLGLVGFVLYKLVVPLPHVLP